MLVSISQLPCIHFDSVYYYLQAKRFCYDTVFSGLHKIFKKSIKMFLYKILSNTIFYHSQYHISISINSLLNLFTFLLTQRMSCFECPNFRNCRSMWQFASNIETAILQYLIKLPTSQLLHFRFLFIYFHYLKETVN